MSDSRHLQVVRGEATGTLLPGDAAPAHRGERTPDPAAADVARLLLTVEPENIRRLSVTLLLDLLALEGDGARGAELACTAAVLAEDLLHAGDHESAGVVIRALRCFEAGPAAASERARAALGGLAAREPRDRAGEPDHRAGDLFVERRRRALIRETGQRGTRVRHGAAARVRRAS